MATPTSDEKVPTHAAVTKTCPRTNMFKVVIDILEYCRSERCSQSQDCMQNISAQENDSGSGESSDDDAERYTVEPVDELGDLQEELARLEINEEASTIETLILIVEFYVKSADIDGFRKNVRRPDSFLRTKPRPKIADLKKMAVNMEKQNLPFRAVMMHKAIATLLKYEYVRHPDDHPLRKELITPNKAIFGIEESIAKSFDLCELLQTEEQKNLYLTHFIPIMYDMLTNLREIRHSNRKYRADCEGWALLFIALVHGKLKEDREMLNVLTSSTDTMKRRFKKNVGNHMIYGISYLTLAVAKVSAGEDALGAIALGLRSLQESTDFATWDAKVNAVAKAEVLADMISKKDSGSSPNNEVPDISGDQINDLTSL